MGVGRIPVEKFLLASDCCLSTTIATFESGFCDLNTDTPQFVRNDSPSCAVPLSSVIANPDFMAPPYIDTVETKPMARPRCRSLALLLSVAPGERS